MHHAFWCGNSPSSNLCTWKSCWKGKTQAGFGSLFHMLFHGHLRSCTTCYWIITLSNSVTVRLLKYPHYMEMKYPYALKSLQIPVPQNLESSAPGVFDVWQENQMLATELQLFAKKISWRNYMKNTVNVTLFQICLICFLLKSCSHSEQTAINIFCRISKCSTARILERK